MSMRNPLTLAGIEPATFRFVAQRFRMGVTGIHYWLSPSGYAMAL